MLNIRSVPIPYRASLWLSVAMLIDLEEMQSLFQSLGEFSIFRVGHLVKEGEGMMTHAHFLSLYGEYIQALKEGRIPEEQLYRHLFSTVFTLADDHLYALPSGQDQQLLRILKPVVQLQSHSLDYSKADGEFRGMVLGKDTVLWGVQFSYPQLYENPDTRHVDKVREQYLNTALFRAIQRWTRENTKPTPFVVGEKVINVPMRLGKKCFTWINQHPQFMDKGLSVEVSRN